VADGGGARGRERRAARVGRAAAAYATIPSWFLTNRRMSAITMMTIEPHGAMICLVPWVTSKTLSMHILGLFSKASPFSFLHPFRATASRLYERRSLPSSEKSYSKFGILLGSLTSTQVWREEQTAPSQHDWEGVAMAAPTMTPDSPPFEYL
jgi:hypothetical protein